MLKKIKSIFIVEEETSPVRPPASSVQADQEDKRMKEAVDIRISSGKAGSPPESGSENRFLHVLAEAIEKSNQQGFDYLEFRQALVNLSKLSMDEPIRYKSAYAAAQAMGVSPSQLISSAKGYLAILEGESKKFAIAEQNQRTRVVEERKNELEQISAEIRSKQDAITKLQAEVEKLTKKLEEKKNEARVMSGKLEQTKVEFETAYKSLFGQISEDIQKMDQYLK
ncbi:MAG TPA: hypothetical protein PKM27_06395 [Saprospiraceae bacterium]|nr:hypothetical protein [Saprospiraceae bacterium]HNT19878.1 hypothetical protein [Saprospiraceae bacterium]